MRASQGGGVCASPQAVRGDKGNSVEKYLGDNEETIMLKFID